MQTYLQLLRQPCIYGFCLIKNKTSQSKLLLENAKNNNCHPQSAPIGEILRARKYILQ